MQDTNINIKDQSLERLEDQLNVIKTIDNISSNLVCYTEIMYYQTQLLKILDDANISHYLYNKIIKWVIEAQMSNINFSDPKNKR